MAISVEARLVALCARVRLEPGVAGRVGRIVLAGGLDWNEVLRVSEEERVSPLLLNTLRGLGLDGALPALVRVRLESHYERTAGWNTIILNELGVLLDAFQAERIPAIVLKGASLAESLYRDIGLRPMEDIDLLVKVKDVAGATVVVQNHGYLPGSRFSLGVPGDPDAYLNSFRFQGRELPNVFIHLHWNLVNNSLPAPGGISTKMMPRVWERARPQTVAGKQTRVMHEDDALIYLAEHAMKHGFQPLVRLTDVLELMPGEEPGGAGARWDDIVRESLLFGLERPLYFCLLLCRRLLSARVPQDVLARLRPGRAGVLEKVALSLAMKNVRFPEMTYPMYVAMAAGLTGKAVFVFRTFFPPRRMLSVIDMIPSERIGLVHYISRLARGLLYGLKLLILALRGIMGVPAQPCSLTKARM